MNQGTKKEKNPAWLSWGVWVVVILVLSQFMGNQSSVSVALAEESLTLTAASGYTAQLLWEDIASVELRDAFDCGTPVDGTDGDKEKSGVWQNDELGEYQLFFNTKLSSCIICLTKAGDPIVFNFESEESTESLYNAILEWLDSLGYEYEIK